jgi:lipopolysaccharide transport system ATP-binding protein
MKPVIALNKISKQYRIPQRAGPYRTLRESIVEKAGAAWALLRGARRCRRTGRARGEAPATIWALKDVSFEVGQGDVVGIIGRNGAGKSTLLKVLSRVTEPTSGQATLAGRVGSLLEVGTGFHPELTGRENVYLNGTILGMRRREVARKFDEIVAFAGVEQFIDTPVKRYSSGMHLRLGFSVAAHLEPEILIMDEVLAVGDAAFQKKCLGKLGQVVRSGRTVLLVSHNMTTIQNICTRAVLLANGRAQAVGDCASVLKAYLLSASCPVVVRGDLSVHRVPDMLSIIQEIALTDAEGERTCRLFAGSGFTIDIHYDSPVPLDSPVFGVFAESLLGEPLFHLQTASQHAPLESLPCKGVARCHVPALPLVPGTYYLSFNCTTLHTPGNLDCLERAVAIDVEPADVFGTGRLPPDHNGPFLVPAVWRFSGDPAVAGAAPAGADGTARVPAEL